MNAGSKKRETDISLNAHFARDHDTLQKNVS